MPLPTSISMPKDLVPVFPERCVVCGFRADGTGKIMHGSLPPLLGFLVPILHLFARTRVEFPVCRRCRRRFYIQRWGRTLVLWVVAIAAVILLQPFFNDWDPALRRYLVVGAAFSILVPFLAMEVFVPRWFDTYASQGATTYQFASKEVAMQFFLANREQYPQANIRIDMDWKPPRM